MSASPIFSVDHEQVRAHSAAASPVVLLPAHRKAEGAPMLDMGEGSREQGYRLFGCR